MGTCAPNACIYNVYAGAAPVLLDENASRIAYGGSYLCAECGWRLSLDTPEVFPKP